MLLSKCSVAALMVCFAMTGCRETPRKAEAAFSSPVSATVVRAAEVEWPSISEAVGTVRARTSTVISSKVMGYVRELKVQLGDNVRAGQLLIVIEVRDLDAAYRQAQAARQEAALATTEANNAAASAQANLDLAKITFQRMADLFEKKSVSNQEYDEAGAKLKVAQANYEMAVSRRAQLGARIQQAEEAVAAAAVARGYSEIRAPLAGTVTAKMVESGSLATPGVPLLTIEQAGALRLEVTVEEGLLAVTRVGQAVTVKLDSVDTVVDAKISEIVPSVDPASSAFTVKIDLPALPHLRSGVYGKAQFSRGTRRTIVVPSAAVSEQGQVQTVMVVEGAYAHTRIVSTGRKQGDLVEILAGMNPGEQVLSPRPANLADGARVETRP